MLTLSCYLDEMWFIYATAAPPCQRGDLLEGLHVTGKSRCLCLRVLVRSPDLPAGAGHAEVLIIHERPHSLGLGENPPTSGQITAKV
jgi:hypothetical protein